MGVYDEYGYLGIQIKMNANGATYKIGESVPLPNGLVFGYEGVAIIEGSVLAAVYPYDQVWDKWGNWIGPSMKAVVEGGNPIKDAVNELVESIKEAEQENENMETYWMVHRYGKKSGPATRVHHNFEDAYSEAERLTRKERDRFVILQAHTMIEPYEPLVITVETIGDPPETVPYPSCLCVLCEDARKLNYPDSLDEKVSGCTCGPSESESGRCTAHDSFSLPSYWKDLMEDSADAFAFALAQAFCVPKGMLERVECCDADHGHGRDEPCPLGPAGCTNPGCSCKD